MLGTSTSPIPAELLQNLGVLPHIPMSVSLLPHSPFPEIGGTLVQTLYSQILCLNICIAAFSQLVCMHNTYFPPLKEAFNFEKWKMSGSITLKANGSINGNSHIILKSYRFIPWSFFEYNHVKLLVRDNIVTRSLTTILIQAQPSDDKRESG